MRIGVPTEIKANENRIAIVPAGVEALVTDGHEVFVQRGAGLGSGISDEELIEAGAKLVDDADELWAMVDMIVKVKEPLPAEYGRCRKDLLVFTYFHFAAARELTDAMIDSGALCFTYETLEIGRRLPLLTPMSEVAGRMAIQVGAHCLEKAQGGRGVLLGGVPGVKPGKVVVIGGGVVGLHAARMAIGLGADVTILDRSLPRLRQLDDIFNGGVHTRFSSIEALENEVFRADLVIGAVLIPGAAAPKLVTRKMLGGMKKGAVIVDVAIDQGGCFETSHATTHSDPTYEIDGIIHYCVANMPGAVPVTSAHALNNATIAHGLALADKGAQAILADRHLRNGLNIHRGKVTNRPVAEALGLEMVEPEAALAA